jgi:hypothetical protein
MSHDWIFDVLTDLRTYAQRNGLAKLAIQIEAALLVAQAEIPLAMRSPDDDGDSEAPPGSAGP